MKPLDDRTPLQPATDCLPGKTGKVPPKAQLPELENDVTVRKVEISAIQKEIVYNDAGDHDPHGLLFVYSEQAEDVLSGKTAPEPIIIRANAGDVIEVTLTNRIKGPLQQTFHPSVPVNTNYPPSERVSLNAGMVLFDPLHSGGVTVGYNPDQTVAPGESITYRWYADRELGTCMLSDMADIMNHRGHGLFGALVIEPEGALYLDAKTLEPLGNVNAQSAVIRSKEGDFREFVLIMQDCLGLLDSEGNQIPDPADTAHGGEHDENGVQGEESAGGDEHGTNGENGENGEDDGVDFEDQGQKGFNYRSELFDNRFTVNDDPLQVFNSNIHGDPATPLLEAYAGEDVTIRLLMAADKPRNNCFVLHGHTWKTQPNDPLSETVWSQGAISIGSVYNIEFTANQYPGDYLYRSGIFRWSIEQGMWGILRVREISNHQVIVLVIIALSVLVLS